MRKEKVTSKKIRNKGRTEGIQRRTSSLQQTREEEGPQDYINVKQWRHEP